MSGLSAVQQGINLANSAHTRAIESSATNQQAVLDPSYHRTETRYVTNVSEGKVSGVTVEVKRQFDQEMQNALFSVNGEQDRAAVLARIHRDFQKNFGAFGSTTTSSNRLSTLFTRVDMLAKSPTNPQTPTLLLNAAKELAAEVSKIANATQAMRQECEQAIEDKVTELNTLLDEVASLNLAISQAKGRSGEIGGLLDKRYEALEKISHIVPIKTDESSDDGAAYVMTQSGLVLVEGPDRMVGLDFTKTQTISPDLSYANGDLSGVINPKQADPVLRDITYKLRGGELEALFTARDQDMPAIQAEIDEWVFNLTREFNAISSEGTTHPAATELVGTRSFNSLSDSLQATGTLRVALVVRESSVIESFEDIDLSTLNTLDDLKTEIEKLGVNVSVSLNSKGQLVISSGEASKGIAMSSLTTTQEANTGLGLPHFLGINTLFHNTTADKVGCANGVSVNDSWIKNPSLVTKGMLTKETITPGSTKASYSGDASALTEMMALRSKKLSFAESGKLTAVTTSLGNYSSSILSAAAHLSSTLKDAAATTATNRQSTFDEYQSIKGVNLEKEMIGISQIASTLEANFAIAAVVRRAQSAWLDSIR